MAVDVVTEAVIGRPVAEVAAYAADPTNAPEWYDNIESVEWVGDAQLQVGARIRFVARFLGRRLTYTYEIRELDPHRRLVMATTEGPFPMETTYTWSAVEGGRTLMALRNRGEPSGFGRFTAPLMAPAMRRANRRDLAALRSRLESGGGRPRPS